MEVYGYTPLQAGWFGAELGNSVLRGAEASYTKQGGDDQGSGLAGAMAALEVKSNLDWRWDISSQGVPADAF